MQLKSSVSGFWLLSPPSAFVSAYAKFGLHVGEEDFFFFFITYSGAFNFHPPPKATVIIIIYFFFLALLIGVVSLPKNV